MIMKRLPVFTLIMVITALAVGMAGVNAPVQAQAGQTLTIGVIGAVDGPTLRGVSLAAEEANAAGFTLPDGSLFNVRVVAVDAGPAVQPALEQLKALGVVAVFGPDSSTIAAASAAALSVAGVPVFTGATSTALRVGGFVQRTRASDAALMDALADALVLDASAKRVAVYQGTDSASQGAAIVEALARRGVIATAVIQDPTRPVADAAAVLLQGQPDTIAAFGETAQVAELFNILKQTGFVGTFATDQASNPAFVKAINPVTRSGIYGVTGWTPAFNGGASAQFILSYVGSFADVPDSLAAAAYDSTKLLVEAIKQSGSEPGAVLAALLRQPVYQGVSGMLNPAGNGELSNAAMVTKINQNGGPTLVARFEGGQRQLLTAGPVFTPAPTALPTLALPPTALPTATPIGVVATVISDRLNVRFGPGTNYEPPIGALQKNQQVQLFGASPDYRWFTINFAGQQGWISGDPTLVSIFGNVQTLPVVPIPPTPTPIATFTPMPLPYPDLVMVSYALNPSQLKSGQPFTLTVTIQNVGGANAGPFAVAAAFDPGGVFGAQNLPGLGVGQFSTITITYPGVVGQGTFKIAVVLDLNSQVDEGPSGEVNNKPEITYQVVP